MPQLFERSERTRRTGKRRGAQGKAVAATMRAGAAARRRAARRRTQSPRARPSAGRMGRRRGPRGAGGVLGGCQADRRAGWCGRRGTTGWAWSGPRPPVRQCHTCALHAAVWATMQGSSLAGSPAGPRAARVSMRSRVCTRCVPGAGFSRPERSSASSSRWCRDRRLSSVTIGHEDARERPRILGQC